MAQQEQNKTQGTDSKRDVRMDNSKQFSDVMDSAKNAIREGLKKAGALIERGGVDAQNADLKTLGEWIERAGDDIENLGEDRPAQRTDGRSDSRDKSRTESRSDNHSDKRSEPRTDGSPDYRTDKSRESNTQKH
jgi:hypothetical protein